MAGEVELSFLTRDHDLGCNDRYDGIELNKWASYAHGRVFYASSKKFGLSALFKALSTSDTDIIYLNSFFSFKGSIAVVARNWVRGFGIPILLAPRGEFSKGALLLKSMKKRWFLKFARHLGLYQAIWWHASTEDEKIDILKQFPDAGSRIFTAEDPVALTDVTPRVASPKSRGLARLIFVSRISPKKNLEGLLEILQSVENRVKLTIYGPIEDEDYWQLCMDRASDLPSHIEVVYEGELAPEAVSDAFASGDLFAFPTHGENFGHVIFEALRAGTPVLVSSETPWQPDETSAVVRLSLTATDAWRDHIDSVSQLTEVEQQNRRIDAIRYAERHATSKKTRGDNLRMFKEIAYSTQRK